jgi:pimeloyl-ACP methyl ester carboxylesterase
MPRFAEEGYKTYGIDLLGYGYSDKPNPKNYEVSELYNFYTWSDLIVQFIETELNGKPCYFVCNSVGGLVGLQTSIARPDLVKGLCLIDISLRMLHIKKQPFYLKPVVKIIQDTLRETDIGKMFFNQVETVFLCFQRHFLLFHII